LIQTRRRIFNST